MPRPGDDDVAWGPAPTDHPQTGSSRTAAPGRFVPRTLALVGGFVLAVAATLAVFLTENPKYLQLAVIVMAWAFVLAAFAAGRRGSDRAAAAAREVQLRQAYELELEREVAARREYELDLEHDLRREAEDAMRDELDALRAEISSLTRLREEVAHVSDLRHDLADLSALRDDVARVAALREDLAALGSLRADLGQLAELRADMGRLRTELTEQLSSEMLVERIVMRTQGARLPADQGRPDAAGHPLDGAASWSDDTPPRELTGGWPAIRLDDPRDLRHAEQVPADRSVPSRHTPPPLWSTGPGTTAFPAAAPPPASSDIWNSTSDRPPPPPTPPVPVPSAAPRPWEESRPWEEFRPWEREAGPPEPAPSWSWEPATEVRPSPAPRPSPRPRPTPPPSARPRPDLPPLTRRVDAGGTGPSTAERHMAGPPPTPPAAGGPDSDSRLAEILAENHVDPSAGGRRRRRYREEGESDDVLARVLGLS